MAFNLLAEATGKVDWRGLATVTKDRRRQIEYFPIPAGGGYERDAIGISIPRAAATEAGWFELESMLRELLGSYGMEITELNTGSKVTQDTLEKLKRRLLGA